MDKKIKQRRQKFPTRDELSDEVRTDPTPPGARFDTEEGRVAQGMRPDLGGKPDEPREVAPPPNGDDGDDAAEDAAH
jgi:hypothetical protein